ncbi:hypothetical protein [Thermosulfurimonas sp. F29]|uniref:hypothetical protein n=1 Tax=Thermosulfurimonas sp. F29 TaxID=2867247 RepID=UPI001C837B89|nr:hypothetical protein [Thermosulfurimonas sp. F29]MBX6424238.1 hypothetical protein [Thermosulfurimonas sp. F29]
MKGTRCWLVGAAGLSFREALFRLRTGRDFRGEERAFLFVPPFPGGILRRDERGWTEVITFQSYAEAEKALRRYTADPGYREWREKGDLEEEELLREIFAGGVMREEEERLRELEARVEGLAKELEALKREVCELRKGMREEGEAELKGTMRLRPRPEAAFDVWTIVGKKRS